MGSIYKITNTVNGKSYIGQTIHDAAKGRINDHLNGVANGSRLVRHAVKKYGKDAFTYEILEENIFPKFLPDLEVHYIKKFNTVAPNGYNLTHGGEIGKKHSPETRQKMSEAKKGKSSHMKGRKHTPESRRKMSEALKGKPSPMKGKKHSQKPAERSLKQRKVENIPQKPAKRCLKHTRAKRIISGANLHRIEGNLALSKLVERYLKHK